MRKNSSKSSQPNEDIIFGDMKEMSDTVLFSQQEGTPNRKRDQRRLKARRKLERYLEDKQLARWIDDPLVDF